MTNIEEINKAITVHTAWKVRLRDALAAGKFDTPVDTVRRDDQCVLGKWLYGPMLTPQDKASEHYKEVVYLHTEFHECAARVLELAMLGKKAEAERMLEYGGGEYPLASSRLVMALSDWKAVSQHAPANHHPAPAIPAPRVKI
jgi:hypothetical protein